MGNSKLQCELQRLRTIFQNVNDAIFLIDINQDKILDANNQALLLLGYSKKEILDTAISKIHPREMLQLKAFSEKAFQQRKGWTNELSCLTKDGRSVPTEISATIVEFDGRECLVSSVRDISDKQKLGLENNYLKKQLNHQTGFEQIVGKSGALNKVLQQVALVAQTDASVLINGETGTGKEMIAHAIHQQSKRANNTLVKVNCASIPNELFESEFFGHVKGSFTGASQNRIGRFELAEGGTLFLDEVSEIPLALQGKLLRVLQENQFERVGESKARKCNVRIIAATNKNLLEESKQKHFRSDLYYRLSVFPIEVPPLRDRLEDLPILVAYFVDRICQRYAFPKPTLLDKDIDRLRLQNWPGNIRELQNEIERTLIHSQGKKLNFGSLRNDQVKQKKTSVIEEPITDNLRLTDLVEMEKTIILRELENSRGRIHGADGAAVALGIPPTTLNYRIKKLGIHK